MADTAVLKAELSALGAATELGFEAGRDATLLRLSFNQLPKTPIHVEKLWQVDRRASGWSRGL